MCVPFDPAFADQFPSHGLTRVRLAFELSQAVVRDRPGWAFPASFEDAVTYLLRDVFTAADPITLARALDGMVEYLTFQVDFVVNETALKEVPHARAYMDGIRRDVTYDVTEAVLVDHARQPVRTHLRDELVHYTYVSLRRRGYI